MLSGTLLTFSILQLPELKAQHDKAIAQAYLSKDLEIEELKQQAQQQWVECGQQAIPDLAILTQANIHGARTEQRVGKETLLATQASI